MYNKVLKNDSQQTDESLMSVRLCMQLSIQLICM